MRALVIASSSQADLEKLASYADQDQVEAVTAIAAEKAAAKAKPKDTRSSIIALADAMRGHEAKRLSSAPKRTLVDTQNMKKLIAPSVYERPVAAVPPHDLMTPPGVSDLKPWTTAEREQSRKDALASLDQILASIQALSTIAS